MKLDLNCDVAVHAYPYEGVYDLSHVLYVVYALIMNLNI